MATKVTATEAARQFSELMNRVKYQGQSFEVIRGNEIVARIVPAGPASPVRVSDLGNLLAQLPALDEGDAATFERDLAEIRDATGREETSEWD